MKIVFFGSGSIGKKHANLLEKYFSHELYAYRHAKKPGENDSGVKEVFSWSEVARLKADLAFITNPTFLHIDTALKCAKLGMNLFIEKPIGSNTNGLNRLLTLAKEKKLTTYVSYCLRFHPVIKYLNSYLKGKKIAHVRIVASSYLPDWRINADYAESYSAKKEQGGGVIFDLSHELDYCNYLFGDILEINGRYGKKSSLKLNCEDYADLLLRCKKAVVNLHLNFFSKDIERSLTINLIDGSFIKADLIRNTVAIGGKGKEVRRVFKNGQSDMYLNQLRYFFGNYGNKKMMNNIFVAANLFRKIVNFKKQYAN